MCATRLRRLTGRLRRSIGRRLGSTGPDRMVPVSEWARRHGVAVEALLEATTVERPLPRTVEPTTLPTYAEHARLALPARVLAVVPGARVLGRYGAVVAPDGTVLRTHEEPGVLDPDRMATERSRVAVEADRPGDWFSLVPAYPRNHYHLLHDAATRLPGVLGHLPPGTRFVLSDETPESHRAVFVALGVPDDRIVVRPSDETWVCERLHVVSPAAYAGHDRPDLDRAVRDAVMVHFGLGWSQPTRRIFVSRQGQKRRVTNEDEVLALLTPLGFESVAPETLSLRDQVALFASAEVVVSNHGSALTGVLFSPPGLVLVDAVDPQMQHCAHVFWSLCEALGHAYWFLRADRIPTPGPVRDDVAIPVGVLAATLERAGVGRA